MQHDLDARRHPCACGWLMQLQNGPEVYMVRRGSHTHTHMWHGHRIGSSRVIAHTKQIDSDQMGCAECAARSIRAWFGCTAARIKSNRIDAAHAAWSVFGSVFVAATAALWDHNARMMRRSNDRGNRTILNIFTGAAKDRLRMHTRHTLLCCVVDLVLFRVCRSGKRIGARDPIYYYMRR